MTEYFNIVMLLCGLLAHYTSDMGRIYNETKILITPWEYWIRNPYQAVLCTIGAIVGYVGLYEYQELTPITAFSVGWMSNSIADKVGKRSINVLDK